MLTPREEKILTLRFCDNPRTLEEIGKEFNVSRERIRQIEENALRKVEGKSSALDFLSRKYFKEEKIKITKYDVHVHEIKGNRLSKEIVGRYFYVQDDELETIKAAVARSTLAEFQPYINNDKYLIHMVTDQELCQCEIDFFMESLITDHDQENFFMTRKKFK